MNGVEQNLLFLVRLQICEKLLSAAYCLSVCLSVRSHEINRVALYTFSLNLVFECFFENLSIKFKFR